MHADLPDVLARVLPQRPAEITPGAAPESPAAMRGWGPAISLRRRRRRLAKSLRDLNGDPIGLGSRSALALAVRRSSGLAVPYGALFTAVEHMFSPHRPRAPITATAAASHASHAVADDITDGGGGLSLAGPPGPGTPICQ